MLSLSPGLTAALAFFLGCLFLVWGYLKRTSSRPPIAGLPFVESLHVPILGCALSLEEIITGTKLLCVDSADEAGLCSFRLVGTPVASVLRADHVRQVLLASNFREPLPIIDKHLKALLGNRALVMLMGDEWKLHRRVVMKAFRFEHLAGMVGDMATVAGSLAARLLRPAADARGTNVFAALKLATLDVIGLTAFGFDFKTVETGGHPVTAAFDWLLDECTRRQFRAPLSPEALW